MTLIAPMFDTLLTRCRLSKRKLAETTGVSPAAIHERLRGRPSALSTQRVLSMARACGATEQELARLEALDAIDRGAIALTHRQEGWDVDVVARACAVLRGEA